MLIWASSVLPESKWKKDSVFEAAESQSEREFYDTVKSLNGGGLEIVEMHKTFQVRVPVSLYDRLWGIIETAKEIHNTDSTAVALDFICSEVGHLLDAHKMESQDGE